MSAAALRIALVAACPFPSPQGSQVFVGQMADRLSARGHEVHLLTYGQGAEQAGRAWRHHRIARLPGDDSSRSGPNLAKPLLDAMLARRLVQVCRTHRIDVVHAHNYEAALAALLARGLTGVPVVYHSHNLMGDELETYFDGPLARRAAGAAGRLLDRTVPARADRTIALCQWSAERLRRAGCREEALAVIPPAIVDDGAVGADASVRSALGLAPDDFVVAYCGNLDAYQNLSLLMRAMKRLGPDPGAGRARLLLATHAPRAEVERLVATFGLGEAACVVELDGYAGARNALAAADVVALPRRLGSGYPVKLLNSMSAAKAVVSAGCGSKVLRHGVDGLVVGDDDEAAFAAAIDVLRRDPGLAASLGAAARETFLATLTWEVVLPRVERVYEGLRGPSSLASDVRERAAKDEDAGGRGAARRRGDQS